MSGNAYACNKIGFRMRVSVGPYPGITCFVGRNETLYFRFQNLRVFIGLCPFKGPQKTRVLEPSIFQPNFYLEIIVLGHFLGRRGGGPQTAFAVQRLYGFDVARKSRV